MVQRTDDSERTSIDRDTHYCPFLCQVLARALALQQGREGSSAVLLEDPDTVSVLELVKEKLYGQMVARLLEGSNKFLFIYLVYILFLSVFLASIPVTGTQ